MSVKHVVWKRPVLFASIKGRAMASLSIGKEKRVVHRLCWISSKRKLRGQQNLLELMESEQKMWGLHSAGVSFHEIVCRIGKFGMLKEEIVRCHEQDILILQQSVRTALCYTFRSPAPQLTLNSLLSLLIRYIMHAYKISFHLDCTFLRYIV